MKALILAAGLGTRLRPLTTTKAKPSLPVLGIPTLWFPTWNLKQTLGIQNIAINVGHAAESIKGAIEIPEIKNAIKAKFYLSDESHKILGSSGALWKLKDWIGNSRLLVCNGDSICFPSWAKMIEFHEKSKSQMTLHLRPFQEVSHTYSHIELSKKGKVKAIQGHLNQGLMFSGCYILEPSLLYRLPSGKSDLKQTLLEPLIQEERLYGYTETIPWFDTGTLESYFHTQFELLRAVPTVRKLVELTMYELSPEVWVPKAWAAETKGKSLGLQLKSPCVFTGRLEDWKNQSDQYGPRFLGIEPPSTKNKIKTKNSLILSDYSHEFS